MRLSLLGLGTKFLLHQHFNLKDLGYYVLFLFKDCDIFEYKCWIILMNPNLKHVIESSKKMIGFEQLYKLIWSFYNYYI